jgi:DNA-binding transcriptional ArsR family regulator
VHLVHKTSRHRQALFAAHELASLLGRPDVPPEALAAAGSLYDLLAALPVGQAASEPRIFSISDLLALEPPAAPWAVAGLLRAPGLALLYGPAGVGKTLVACEIAFAVAAGVPLFDRFEAAQASVLVVEADMPALGFAERLRAMRPDPTLSVSFSFDPLRLDDPKTVGWFAARPEAFIIVDPLLRAHGQVENEASAMAGLFARAFKPLILAGKSLLLLHHSRKPQAGEAPDPLDMARGSGDLAAQVDTAFYLSRMSDGRLVLRQTKSRYSASVPPLLLSISSGDGGLHVCCEGTVEDERAARIETARDRILDVLGGRLLGVDDLEMELPGVRRDAVRQALRALEAERLVERRRVGRKHMWSLNGRRHPEQEPLASPGGGEPADA